MKIPGPAQPELPNLVAMNTRLRSVMTGLACATLLLMAFPASVKADMPAVEFASLGKPVPLKKGPPPGTTTRQIEKWVKEALMQQKGFNECTPTAIYPCELEFDMGKLRWLGTQRVCVEGVFGQPCLKYGTAYVARVNVLVKTKSYNSLTDSTTAGLYQYGYWDGGRNVLTYQPWPDGPTWRADCGLDCGKDLYVRKGLGRWYYGFGGATYYLR